MTSLAGFGSPFHWLIIVAILLLVFHKGLPSMMRLLGQGVVQFKQGRQGVDEDVRPVGTIGEQPDTLQATPFSSNELSEAVTVKRLAAIENRIRELREAAKTAKQRSASIWTQCAKIRCQLSYLSIAQFFRETIAPILGWRWAVVLIGATAVGGLFVVLFLSWVAGLSGMAVGVALLAPFVSVPSDARLTVAVPTLKGLLAELGLRGNEERSNLSQIEKDISVERDNQRQVAGQLEQYRQSHLYRLRKLAARNWKAMRGGELEAFLEAVFSELQYSVERIGGAGDQGVDLIVSKAGRRIAVQVKGYVDSVPNTAIQEAYTGMAVHKCDACAVVTNSRFTTGGKNAAASVGCALIDENTLPKLITGQIDLWQETLAARTRNRPGVAGVA
jgi:Sec-independent protein translocase protein TatA